MADERGSLGPWLLGCGLLGLLGVLVCAGVFVWQMPRVMQQVEQLAEEVSQEISRQQLAQSFPAGWQGPAEGAGPEELFPETVGQFSRASHDEEVDLPEFDLTGLAGQHARYESGAAAMDVYVYPLADSSREAVFEQVEQAVDEADYDVRFTSSQSGPDSAGYAFSVSPPWRSGWLLWRDGWMFLFLTEGEEGEQESEEQFEVSWFIPEYLGAIQSAETSGAATPAPLESDADPATDPLRAPEDADSQSGEESRELESPPDAERSSDAEATPETGDRNQSR